MDLCCTAVCEIDDSGVTMNMHLEERGGTQFNRPLDIIYRWRRWIAEGCPDEDNQEYFDIGPDSDSVEYNRVTGLYKVTYSELIPSSTLGASYTRTTRVRYFRFDWCDNLTEVWMDTNGNEVAYPPHALKA